MATYCFFLIFLALEVHYVMSSWAAAALWVWWGFELQRIVVFRASLVASAFWRFLGVQVLSSIVSTGLIAVLVEIFGLAPQVSYLVSLIMVVVLQYLASQMLVFRQF